MAKPTKAVWSTQAVENWACKMRILKIDADHRTRRKLVKVLRDMHQCFGQDFDHDAVYKEAETR